MRTSLEKVEGDDIRISHITIDTINFGIYFFGTGTSTNIFVSDVTVSHASNTSYLFSSCEGICVNCIAQDSVAVFSSGFFVQNSPSYFLLKNNQAINVYRGYSFSALSSSTDGPIIIADSCMAYNSSDVGFYISAGYVGIYNCISSYNDIYGFYIGNTAVGIISGCVAADNDLGGFILQSNGTQVKFTGNNALDTVSSANYGYEVAVQSVVGYSTTQTPFWWVSWINSKANKWQNVAL